MGWRRGRQTDRQSKRETDRQTDREGRREGVGGGGGVRERERERERESKNREGGDRAKTERERGRGERQRRRGRGEGSFRQDKGAYLRVCVRGNDKPCQLHLAIILQRAPLVWPTFIVRGAATVGIGDASSLNFPNPSSFHCCKEQGRCVV